MTPGTRRLLYVVGTRASAIALWPALVELRRRLPGSRHALVHTSSEAISAELPLPDPDYLLGVAPSDPVGETTAVMERIERVLEIERPDLVLLAGDAADTLSAALTALKLQIPTAQIDAGLRTFDRQAPEEVHRVMLDAFAELLFASSDQAIVNLRAEGVPSARVHPVGSTAIDTVVGLVDRLEAAEVAHELGLRPGSYLLAVLRDSTFADPLRLHPMLEGLAALAAEMPVALATPARAPRGWPSRFVRSGVRCVKGLGYPERISLESTAAAVVTDAGPVQDETTFMGVPCLTLGASTERTTSVERETNLLAPSGIPTIEGVRETIDCARRAPAQPPPLWDGRAGERVARVIEAWLARDAIRQAPGAFEQVGAR